MGQRHSKSTLRNAIIYLNISADTIDLDDEKFWRQIWMEDTSVAEDIIKSISNQEIRMLRDGSPKNFAALTFKMVEKLHLATGTLCNTHSQQTAVINATKILIRIIPSIFEDREWRYFFTINRLSITARDRNNGLIFPEKGDDKKNYQAYLPHGTNVSVHEDCDNNTDDECCETYNLIDTGNPVNGSVKNDIPVMEVALFTSNASDITDGGSTLMESLILAACDLLFCPEFTVSPLRDRYLNSTIDAPPEDLKSLSTCDYVWEPGVGFESSANSTTYFDKSRSDLLRLLLVCNSLTLYQRPSSSIKRKNQWIEVFASKLNRHALPLFTSLLNVVFNYVPSRASPISHLLSYEDTREELVELSIQILIATLDYQFDEESAAKLSQDGTRKKKLEIKGNLFIEYMSRIHKDGDFDFIIKGFVRLMNNRLESQSFLLGLSKHVNFEHELLILFWRFCNLNRKFISYILKKNEILDIVVPILYHLNENFQDAGKTGIIHIGVFNLLILSGEREFGVKLNKSCHTNALTKLPVFSGSHADLMIIVFHKLILYGHNLHQLFDFLMTILVNTSPYLKGLTVIASKCLMQLFEIFSSSYVIFTEPNHHQLVVFLLEIFNNIIQYQFDSNANLVYTMISKKDAFQSLADLPTSDRGIQKVLNKLIRKKQQHKELIDKMSVEQKSTNPDSSSTNGSSSEVDKLDCNQGDSPAPSSANDLNLNQIGATVTSRSNSATKSCNSSTSSMQQDLQLGRHKQGVSLVATPDIYRVTQAIHPFDTDNEASAQVFFGPSNQTADIQTFNLDDILYHASLHDDNVSRELNAETMAPTSRFDPLLENTESMGEFGLSAEKVDVDIATVDLIKGRGKPTYKDQDTIKKWKPTSEWVKLWKQTLPLQTSMRMIEVLSPQIDGLRNDTQKQQVNEFDMIKFLQDGTLVGLLPVPHPILIRKYHTNDETTLWFRACTWGIIYVRNSMWADTRIRLIKIV